MKYRIIDTVLASAALSLTIFFFIPMSIYLQNQSEFYSGPGEVARLLVLLSVGAVIVVSLVSRITARKARRYLVFGMAFLTLGAWIQAYLFNWDYGSFDGSNLDFRFFEARSADIVLWMLLAVCFGVLSVRSRLSPRTLFLVLLFIQSGNLLFSLQTTAPGTTAVTREGAGAISKLNQFTFSSDKNIIMLVLDGYQTDVFNEYLESHPEFKSKLPGFTYYPDALATSYFSARSIPVIFTGQVYENKGPFPEYVAYAYANYSMPAVLKRAGYYAGVYNDFTLAHSCFHPNRFQGIADNYTEEEEHFEPYYGHEIRRILAVALFRIAPHLAKEAIYTRWLLDAPLEQDRDVFAHGMQNYARVGSNQPRFNYYHLQGLHQPHIINGERLDWQDRDSSRQIAHLLAELKERFVDRLQWLGVYDDAAVFIIADHGLLWVSEQMRYGRFDSPASHQQLPLDIFAKKPRALPLVLFKPPGAQGDLVLSEKPVSLEDITPTVLDIAAVLNEDNYSGTSLLRLDEAPRVRRFFSSEYRRRTQGPIYEYAITGFSWYDHAWNFTGNQYFRGEVQRVIFDNYIPGTPLSFGKGGQGIQFLDEHWRAQEGAHGMTASAAAIFLPLQAIEGDYLLRLDISPNMRDEVFNAPIVRVYINNAEFIAHPLGNRDTLEIAVDASVLAFEGGAPEQEEPRHPWFAPVPAPSDTRLNIRFELEQPADVSGDADTQTQHDHTMLLYALTLTESAI